MRLGDIAGLIFRDKLTGLRRRLVGGVIILFCTVGGLIELTSAARVYLEPLTGSAWARVILAAAFLLVAAVTAALVQYPGYAQGPQPSAPEGATGDETLKRRVTIIAEAVGLGLSLGRDFRKAAQPDDKDRTTADPDETGGAPDAAAKDPSASP